MSLRDQTNKGKRVDSTRAPRYSYHLAWVVGVSGCESSVPAGVNLWWSVFACLRALSCCCSLEDGRVEGCWVWSAASLRSVMFRNEDNNRLAGKGRSSVCKLSVKNLGNNPRLPGISVRPIARCWRLCWGVFPIGCNTVGVERLLPLAFVRPWRVGKVLMLVGHMSMVPLCVGSLLGWSSYQALHFGFPPGWARNTVQFWASPALWEDNQSSVWGGHLPPPRGRLFMLDAGGRLR